VGNYQAPALHTSRTLEALISSSYVAVANSEAKADDQPEFQWNGVIPKIVDANACQKIANGFRG